MTEQPEELWELHSIYCDCERCEAFRNIKKESKDDRV